MENASLLALYRQYMAEKNAKIGYLNIFPDGFHPSDL